MLHFKFRNELDKERADGFGREMEKNGRRMERRLSLRGGGVARQIQTGI